MSSRVQSLNLNGKISNSLLKDQKSKFNSGKPKNFGNNLEENIDSIENLKRLTRFSSYNESDIKNSANTLKWEESSNEEDLTDKNLYEERIGGSLDSNKIITGSGICYENKLDRSILLKRNFEDLTQLESSLSLYDDVAEEDKYMMKCPSCPEKVFRKADEMTVFENSNDEIDFYTNEKIVSNSCWSEISKLRHFGSNLELYSTSNKKSKLAFNFLEEFALGEGINYLSDFGFHESDNNMHITEDGFYPLQHSNDYIHNLIDSESDSESEDIKNYIDQKRKMIEKRSKSKLSDSWSSDLKYSLTNDVNCVDDSKNTLIASFNSLQINQNFNSDKADNKILEVFDFIKEYKNLVNSVSIKFEKNRILINGKPLENRERSTLVEYQEVKTVGNGAYGKLVECIHLPTNKRVILKRIPVSNINHWYINDVMTMEEYSLRKNIHPRIITLHDAFFYHPNTPKLEKEKSISKSVKSQTLASNIKNKFKNLNKVLRGGKKKKRKDKGKDKEMDIKDDDENEDADEQQLKHSNDEFVLVTEYLCKGSMDLYDYIETVGPIPEDNVRYIFAQIVEAVFFMSKNGFSHGDIKDENILIDPSTFKIKLIDFGSATTNIEHAEIPYSKFRGTRKYQAPNIYNKDTFDPLAQDVWSLGVMFFVMLFAADPFTSPEEAEKVDILEQLYENIHYVKVEKGMNISEEAIDLIMKMLEKDETARITLEEIIYHSFFRI